MKTSKSLSSLLFFAAFFISCGGGGDTDGGGPQAGSPFVSDGGAGASISLDVSGSLSVTGTRSFFVTLRDPNGQPLKFVDVTCDSERGIAIIEPSSGREKTGADGRMSGIVGGVLPGSYVLECRAPQGFGLVARKTISITGSVPDSFEGFPGSAGGGLGGGSVIGGNDDENPIPGIDAEAVVVASSTFTDAGGTSPFGAPIDIVRDGDCDNDPATDDLEPFLFVTYAITVQNNSSSRIFIDSVSIDVDDGQPASSTGTQPKNVQIARESSGAITGLFIDHPVYVAGSPTVAGTYDALITVTFTTEEGDTFTVRDTTSVSLSGVDNC